MQIHGSKTRAGARGKKSVHMRSVNGANGPLEENIVKLAEKGVLKGIGRGAVRRQRRRGLPVTFKMGQKVIKRYADGKEEVLGQIEPVKFSVPPGVRIFGKS